MLGREPMSQYAEFTAVDDAVHARHPEHGWAASKAGVRQLRIPTLTLYQFGGPTYSYFTNRNLAGTWLQFRSPYRTMMHLATALKEVHKEAREIMPLVAPHFEDHLASDERDERETRLASGQARIEIEILAAIVLLRRLADELVDASRPFLFTHFDSAPKNMKGAVELARKGHLNRAGPRCDPTLLTDLLLNNTEWWANLRKDNGIRDILVHKPHLLTVSGAGSREPGKEWRYRLDASLTYWTRTGITSVEVFAALRECIAGACDFMTGLYVCAVPAPVSKFDMRDALIVLGQDNDAVGFWPPILGDAQLFPMMT